MPDVIDVDGATIVERGYYFHICAPQWFARDDFQAWRTSGLVAAWGVNPLDTTEEHEDSHAFITFAEVDYVPDSTADDLASYGGPYRWDGPNADEDLPRDIYQTIGQLLWDAGMNRRSYGCEGVLCIRATTSVALS